MVRQQPADERYRCDCKDGGNEDRGDAIGDALHRRQAPLRARDDLGNVGECGAGADRRRAYQERSVAVEGALLDAVARPGFNRHAFAGEHRAIDRTCTFDDLAVDGNAFAGCNRNDIADA